MGKLIKLQACKKTMDNTQLRYIVITEAPQSTGSY